jgi:hypothetical protein
MKFKDLEVGQCFTINHYKRKTVYRKSFFGRQAGRICTRGNSAGFNWSAVDPDTDVELVS